MPDLFASKIAIFVSLVEVVFVSAGAEAGKASASVIEESFSFIDSACLEMIAASPRVKFVVLAL